MECPICMDDIQACNINCVTTECGHQFHTSCLMRNIAHNGFGCPYCRNVMAEEPDQSDEEDEEDEYEEDEEETVISEMTNTGEANESLEGLRLLFRRVSQDLEDAEEEDYDDDDVIPKSPQEIADSLVREGYTMMDMVKAFVLNNGYYFGNEHGSKNQQEEFMDKIDEHMRGFLIGQAEAGQAEAGQVETTGSQAGAEQVVEVEQVAESGVRQAQAGAGAEDEVQEPLPKFSLHFKVINNVWKLWNPQDHLFDADSKQVNKRMEVEECL